MHDAGIAEQHAVTLAAGLAARGLRPVVCIYSTFLQRALDQVIHDVVLPGLPVTFAIDRAGLVGADGATHQGTYDLAFLRPLPGLRLYAPTVGEDVDPVLETALAGPGPAAFRFPRGTLPTTPARLEVESGPVAGARWLRRPERRGRGDRLARTAGARRARGRRGARDPDGGARRARPGPLDAARVLEACATGHVVTVEEGTVHGGLGSAVLELAAARGLLLRVRTLGLPDTPVPHGDARTQRRALGLSAEGIAAAVRGVLARLRSESAQRGRGPDPGGARRAQPRSPRGRRGTVGWLGAVRTASAISNPPVGAEPARPGAGDHLRPAPSTRGV